MYIPVIIIRIARPRRDWPLASGVKRARKAAAVELVARKLRSRSLASASLSRKRMLARLAVTQAIRTFQLQSRLAYGLVDALLATSMEKYAV